MSLPPLTYLTFDSLVEGVGVSQVLPYVERLGRRGMQVTVHSYEQTAPTEAVSRRLREADIAWRPHAFGRPGAAGGAVRVARGAACVTGAELVHARADLAAASTLMTRRGPWLWDVRAFWREERISQGLLREGSPEERILRRLESRAAASSDRIITLARRAIDVLARRHGASVAAKADVVTTCADLERFAAAPMPPREPLRFVLAGTLNRLYDVPTMMDFVHRMRRHGEAELTVLTSPGGPWEAELAAAGASVRRVAPTAMPAEVQQHHVGLCLRFREFGATSTAATPTKLGEYLACGRPVVVSAGLGDMDALVAEYRCGVVVGSAGDEDVEDAAQRLVHLLEDPDLATRCRALAEAHFNVERGVDQLIAAYQAAAR